MKSNFDRCLTELLKHEGGFVNHPSDPGGMTNLGVTKKVWEEWVMPKPVTEADLRSLTPALVAPLYKNKYWDACRCDDLPDGLDYCVFDTAVNSGSSRAIKFLQAIVGCTPDGKIGPVTLQSVEADAESGVDHLIEEYCAKRQAFWESLSTFKTFGKGWTRRGKEVCAAALDMCDEGVT